MKFRTFLWSFAPFLFAALSWVFVLLLSIVIFSYVRWSGVLKIMSDSSNR